MSTAAHMTEIFVRKQCPFAIRIALIWCLNNPPSPCSKFNCSCSYCIARSRGTTYYSIIP